MNYHFEFNPASDVIEKILQNLYQYQLDKLAKEHMRESSLDFSLELFQRIYLNSKKPHDFNAQEELLEDSEPNCGWKESYLCMHCGPLDTVKKNKKLLLSINSIRGEKTKEIPKKAKLTLSQSAVHEPTQSNSNNS